MNLEKKKINHLRNLGRLNFQKFQTWQIGWSFISKKDSHPLIDWFGASWIYQKIGRRSLTTEFPSPVRHVGVIGLCGDISFRVI